MYKFISTFLFSLVFVLCFGQGTNTVIKNYQPFLDGISVGKSTKPDASAVFEAYSSTKGILIPRMTRANRVSIASPATSLMVYQTDDFSAAETKGYWYYNGSAWVKNIGATGATGATGSTGATGNNGATGATGATGGVTGITVGATTISSGTTLRIPYNLSGVYQEQANFTINAVATGVLDVPVGLAVAGTQILKWNSGGLNLGSSTPALQDKSTIIGNAAGLNNTGSNNTFLGYGEGVNSGAGSCNVFIGVTNTVAAPSGTNGSIAIGFETVVTASNQGVLGGNNSSGHIDNWYFNGVKHTAPYPTALRGSGGNGSNVPGAVLSLIPGISNGNATTNGYLSISTCPTALASGVTPQTVTEVVRITKTGDILMLNAANGLILKDAAGTPHYWRVTISTLGVLTTADLGTSIPN